MTCVVEPSGIFWCIVTQMLVCASGVTLGSVTDAHSPEKPPTGAAGQSDFRALVESNKPVVEKSAFVKVVLHEQLNVVLITRPRKFAKSINLSMLKHFLNINENSTDIFRNDSVVTWSPKFCSTFQNKWPVIYIDFTDRESTTFEQALNCVKSKMSQLYEEFKYLLQNLGSTEAQQFNRIVAKGGTESETAFAILDLMELLVAHHKRQVFLLIDGYDSPIVQAFQNKFYEKMTYFLKTALNKVIQHDAWLKKSIIMGTLPIAKEVILEGLGERYSTYSFSVSDNYHEYFGFLEPEVKNLTRAYKLPTNVLDEMSKRYRGYSGFVETVYNPWSVVNCLERNGLVNDYWIASGVTAKAFSDLLETRGVIPIIQSKVLLDGGPLIFAFDFNLTLPNTKVNLDSFWTMIVHSGYLSIDHEKGSSQDLAGNICYPLKIPNEEVKAAFTTVVQGYFKKRPIPKYEVFIDSIKNRNFSVVQNCLQSYMNNAGRFFNGDTLEGFEGFFKSLIGGLRKDYESITTEREAGSDELAIKLELSQKLDDLIFAVKFKSKNETKPGIYKQILIKICKLFRGKAPPQIKVSTCHGTFLMTIDVQKPEQTLC